LAEAVNSAITGLTFLDVYRAVELPEEHELFNVHQNTNINCPVGKNIQTALEEPLNKLQSKMEEELSKVTLDQVVTDIQALVVFL
jgi:DNA-binding IscR family transcriptional regulator